MLSIYNLLSLYENISLNASVVEWLEWMTSNPVTFLVWVLSLGDALVV
jgi:hypothetical protein